jgi:hypothetical protein
MKLKDLKLELIYLVLITLGILGTPNFRHFFNYKQNFHSNKKYATTWN